MSGYRKLPEQLTEEELFAAVQTTDPVLIRMADNLVKKVKERKPGIQFSRSSALLVIAATGLALDHKRFRMALQKE